MEHQGVGVKYKDWPTWRQKIIERLAAEKAEKSAKRGRTESSSSPPERPPTPGGAKLGDWMRCIEGTGIINAQSGEIESLKKTVEQLCGELKSFETLLQTNVEEITEAVEISEAKASASVSDLQRTFDGQLQVAAEATD